MLVIGIVLIIIGVVGLIFAALLNETKELSYLDDFDILDVDDKNGDSFDVYNSDSKEQEPNKKL